MVLNCTGEAQYNSAAVALEGNGIVLKASEIIVKDRQGSIDVEVMHDGRKG